MSGAGRDRGSATATVLVGVLAATLGGTVWLTRDVGRALSARSTAGAVASGAARSAAQQLDVSALRSGDGSAAASTRRLQLDPVRARVAADATTRELLAGAGVDGELVGVTVDGDLVRVTVVVHGPTGDVTATGAAEAVLLP